MDEVDQYLGRLAEDAARSASIITDLRAEIDRLKDWFREHNIAGDSSPRRDSVDREAIALLTRAQHQADRLLAAAREQAQRLVYDARGQRDEIVGAAREEAERAAHAYRLRAGASYNADTEARHRQLAWLRTVSAALGTVRAQLPAVAEQVEAISGLFSHEMRKLQDELGTDYVPLHEPVRRH
jgi:cell division septum initiation protein DivIVA